MTERRRRKKREEGEPNEDVELNDEQNEIAKYLRFNCPTKSSTYRGNKVEYFKGSKAIDCLLESKWATSKKEDEALFIDRESAQEFLQMLLEHETFKRVIRVRKKKKSEEEKKAKESSKTSNEKSCSETEDGKKKKVKVKLEVIDHQVFLDGDEVYMWIFDPIHPRTIVYGVLVVIGAVFVCLFPLWPLQMREYVWYLSVAAASLLGTLLVVALLRYPVFAIVWLSTAGQHHFWFLPNLMGDCGVKESFIPLYTLTTINKDEENEEQEKDNKEQDKDTEEQNEGKNGDDEPPKDNDEPTKDKDEPTKDKDEPIKDKDEPTKDNDKPTKDNDKPTKDNDDQSGVNDELTKAGSARLDKEAWVQVTPEDIAQAKEATATTESGNSLVTREAAENIL